MFRTTLAALLALAMIAPASAAPASKTSDQPFEFIGFSSTPAQGGNGLPGMNLICQTDFGRSDVRMATTKEYMVSTNTETPASPAWINPFILGASNVSIGYVLDYSGQQENMQNLSCGWLWDNSAPGSNTGLAVTLNGTIARRTCDQSLLVACSGRGQ